MIKEEKKNEWWHEREGIKKRRENQRGRGGCLERKVFLFTLLRF